MLAIHTFWRFARCCPKLFNNHCSVFVLLWFHFYPILFHFCSTFSFGVPLLFHFCSIFVPLLFHFCSIFVPLLFHFCSVFVPVLFKQNVSVTKFVLVCFRLFPFLCLDIYYTCMFVSFHTAVFRLHCLSRPALHIRGSPTIEEYVGKAS